MRAGQFDMIFWDREMLWHGDHVVAPLVRALGHPGLITARHRLLPRLRHRLKPQHVGKIEDEFHSWHPIQAGALATRPPHATAPRPTRGGASRWSRSTPATNSPPMEGSTSLRTASAGAGIRARNPKR